MDRDGTGSVEVTKVLKKMQLLNIISPHTKTNGRVPGRTDRCHLGAYEPRIVFVQTTESLQDENSYTFVILSQRGLFRLNYIFFPKFSCFSGHDNLLILHLDRRLCQTGSQATRLKKRNPSHEGSYRCDLLNYVHAELRTWQELTL